MYVVLVVIPTCVPFLKTRYPTTPTLSVDAAHESDTCVCVIPVAESPVGTEGVVVSEGVPDKDFESKALACWKANGLNRLVIQILA